MFEEPRLVPGANLVQLPRFTAVDQVAGHHDRLVESREIKYKTIKCVGGLGSAVDFLVLIDTCGDLNGFTVNLISV